MIKNKLKRGFTLVETLIALGIFSMFMTVLISSYSGIVRSLKEANDYRIMYADARRVFDSVIAEFREGMVDYGKSGCQSAFLTGPKTEVDLISKDGVSSTNISRVEIPELNTADRNKKRGVIMVSKGPANEIILNSPEVDVTNFQVFTYPHLDPYDQRNVFKDAYQFQPFVLVKATFQKEKFNGEPFTVSFETAVSSRIYNQVYNPNYTGTCQ
ncbi:type II secretion system GspH family protein [Candidatus Gracilibacteria bacterium]|jgi:prepilin-type N-terminal cleavage/methylation domain-containing protein|nr:type II secretion system GspH family protein [Candidatus Gracilibacteria bacterium]